MSEELRFLKAADETDVVEGRLFRTEVDGELVCLTRIEDTIYAFSDNCTHISGPISDGGLEGCVVTCPWHGAQFDVRDGKVLRGPAKQPLYTYPLQVREDGIYIHVPPE